MNSPRRGFTLVELIVGSAVAAIVLVLLSRFFLNYYVANWEAQSRMRLQRDMRTLSYWIRQDLTALAQRSGNFDLKSGTRDFMFYAADDPQNAADWASNSADQGLDSFVYTFTANKATRTHHAGGGLAPKQTFIELESIEAARGDTYDVVVTLRDLNDSTVTAAQFDATLGNFDYTTAPIRVVDIDLVFSKRPLGRIFGNRPPIIERASLKSVAHYRRGT